MNAVRVAVDPESPPPQSAVLARLRAGVAIAFTLVVGLFLPFVAYAALGRARLDVSATMYALLMVVYGVTFLLACAEGVASLRSPARTERISRVNAVLWRPAYVWLAFQSLPLLAYWIWRHDPRHHRAWIPPIVILLLAWALHRVPAQTLFAYLRADRGGGRRLGRVLVQCVVSLLYLAPACNQAARIAQARSIMGGSSSGDGLPRRDVTPAAGSVPGRRDRESDVERSPDRGLSSEHSPAQPHRTPEGSSTAQGRSGTSAGTVVEAKSVQDDRTRALELARQLAHMVDAMVRIRDERADEVRRMRLRAQALEEALDAHRSLALQLHAALESPVTDADVDAVLATLEQLQSKPNDVTALVTLSQHSRALVQAVQSFAIMQRALDRL